MLLSHFITFVSSRPVPEIQDSRQRCKKTLIESLDGIKAEPDIRSYVKWHCREDRLLRSSKPLPSCHSVVWVMDSRRQRSICAPIPDGIYYWGEQCV